MKCKYRKKCGHYDEYGFTCNKDQFRDDGEPFCGFYRKFWEMETGINKFTFFYAVCTVMIIVLMALLFMSAIGE
jgi:hypothetical protein